MRQPQTGEGCRSALEEQLADRIEDGRLTIPVLPAAAAEVIRLVNDPTSEVAALAARIRNDPALAAHVLRYANSPLLRGATPLVSLQQAITRLGMRNVADVAFAACLGPRLFKAPAYAGLIERTWRESLATAVWAREIARTLRRNVEVSFLCGLLHQIGQPVLLQAVQEELDAGTPAPGERELAVMLARHARAAGLQVALAWHLPQQPVEVIGHVHAFASAPRERALVAMIAAARAFAASLSGDGVPDAQQLADGAEMAEINLYLADIERLLEQSQAVRGTLQEMAV